MESKKKKIITSKETKAKVETTGKEPKKESAMIAPAIGKRLLQASTTLYIFVAAMLFTLNSVIRNTIRFADHHRLLWTDQTRFLLKTVHSHTLLFRVRPTQNE